MRSVPPADGSRVGRLKIWGFIPTREERDTPCTLSRELGKGRSEQRALTYQNHKKKPMGKSRREDVTSPPPRTKFVRHPEKEEEMRVL